MYCYISLFMRNKKSLLIKDHVHCLKKCKQQLKLLGKGTSLAVHWLRFCASTVMGMGSIPGWVTKIPPAMWCSQ